MPISIITYHQLIRDGDGSDERQAVLVRDFEEQVRLLKRDDFRVVDIRELGVPRSGPEEKDRKKVIVTFDDGHASHYWEGFRVLAENGLTGIFFVTTDWVGKPGYVSWNELREMLGKGMAIGSHTMSHPYLPDLDQERLRKELKGSKQILEESLGCGIEFLSLPGGFSSRRVARMARIEGYRGICTSVPDKNRAGEASFRVLDRFMISRETTLERFERIVGADDRLVRRLRNAYRMKNLVKMAIGNKAYDRLWARYKKRIREDTGR